MVEREAAEAEIRHAANNASMRAMREKRDTAIASMNTKVMEEENRRNNEVESAITKTDTCRAEVTDGIHAVPNGEEEQHVGKGALVQVVTPLGDDRGKASKVEMNDKHEVQNSAVADANTEVQTAMDKAASNAGSPYENFRIENKKRADKTKRENEEFLKKMDDDRIAFMKGIQS